MARKKLSDSERKKSRKKTTREYYKRNKEKIREQQKEYWEDNKDKLKAEHNAYYYKNRDKILYNRKAKRMAAALKRMQEKNV